MNQERAEAERSLGRQSSTASAMQYSELLPLNVMAADKDATPRENRAFNI